MTRRPRRRVPRSTAIACLPTKANSPHSHACALHQLAEIQLHAPATPLPLFSAPVSPPSSPLFRPPKSATFGAWKAWRPQAKDEWCTAPGRQWEWLGTSHWWDSYHWNQPYQSSFNSANPRTWCHSPSFHGFGARGLWIHSCFFQQICGRRRSHQKHSFSASFSLSGLHHGSPSIIRHSTTNTSLSHPRCHHLAMWAWPFFFFVGKLSRYFPRPPN